MIVIDIICTASLENLNDFIKNEYSKDRGSEVYDLVCELINKINKVNPKVAKILSDTSEQCIKE